MFYNKRFKEITEDLKKLLDWSLTDQKSVKYIEIEIKALQQINDSLTNRVYLLEEKIDALTVKEFIPEPIVLSDIGFDCDSKFCFTAFTQLINGE
jgi:hypothetical protein